MQVNLVSADEVADALHIHRTTLRRWARQGYFPRPTYLGRRAFYDPVQVSEFINKQTADLRIEAENEQSRQWQEAAAPGPRARRHVA